MAISIRNSQKKVKLELRLIRQTLKKLLRLVNCRDKELSLLVVDDAAIQEINARYLGRNYPTNVISFAFAEGEFSGINPQILGDIVISAETALRDADSGNLPLSDEMDFLIIHGLLHLLGYNHETDNGEERELMQKKEQELFFLLHGYPLEL